MIEAIIKAIRSTCLILSGIGLLISWASIGKESWNCCILITIISIVIAECINTN